MGSNMAEQHPVGFQWVIEAKERGAKVIHVDPRFTRTSAMADLHVPLRAGQRHRVPRRDHQLHPRATAVSSASTCRHYTNARVIIKEEFRDTEDLDGLFSGWEPEDRAYEIESVGLRGHLGRADGRASPSRRATSPATRRTARTA